MRRVARLPRAGWRCISDVNKLNNFMGHTSPEMLWRHYHRAVTQKRENLLENRAAYKIIDYLFLNLPILSSIAPMCERKICIVGLISLLSLSGLSAPAPSPRPHSSEADKLDRREDRSPRAFPNSPTVTATLSDSKATVGVTLKLQIRLHGTASAKASGVILDKIKNAKVPDIIVDGLEIYPTGNSLQYQMHKSIVSETITYDFTILPLKAGKFKIPPQNIQIPGGSLATPELELNVADSTNSREQVIVQQQIEATKLSQQVDQLSNSGRYSLAIPIATKALELREKTLGAEHPLTSASLNTLGELYVRIGGYAKAEPLFQRALRIDEGVLGSDHVDTSRSISNLGWLYTNMAHYEKAEPLYQQALRIREKALGLGNSSTALSLNRLGQLYTLMKRYDKAEPLYQRALNTDEQALGPEHRDTATCLSNLALLYLRMGDYVKAEPLYQRALKIEKVLGQGHPRTTNTLENLALLYEQIGKTKEGLDLAVQARRGREELLSNILSFTSEEERLAFQKTNHPYDVAATLGSGPELAETVLREKGVVLDSLLEDRLVARASGDPKQLAIVEQLRADKQRLMQLQLETPQDLSAQAQKKRDTEKEKLSVELEQLEAALARQLAGLGKVRRALSVTVQQVQSALPKQAALIELLRYSHYLGKDKEEPRYGAIVIGRSDGPSWIPLGNAVEIEKNVELYQKSVRGKTDEATLSSVLRALNNQVWAPIEKALPAGTTTVIVSPDAALSFVSFATLVGPDDKFLAEKYSIRYVASGRDLLQQTKASRNPQTAVYANPDFDSKASSPDSNRGSAVALRSLEMRDLQTISFLPLPGTEAEATALEKRVGKSAKVFLGPNATEAELRQVNSPHFLHLATHGFFLPEAELGGKELNPLQPGEEIPRANLVNPMHRSGLALAGAATTLQEWARGEAPPTENDGIVTADEAGGLKLDGTWLVVLSACETGSGQARAGEGVMGLRRGFIQAGAQNLLITLWPISDETTVQIMLDFYDAALKSGNAPQALADVSRDWLVKLRKERGLLDAVRLAGPFIMSSQGKQ